MPGDHVGGCGQGLLWPGEHAALRQEHPGAHEEVLHQRQESGQGAALRKYSGGGFIPFSVHHFLRSFQKRAGGYNAFEKDFAIINIFFGDSTAFGMMNCILCLSKEILYRIWEKGEDDGDRLHFFARRTVWSVPWIQSHVLCGDHLLVLCRNGAKDAVQKMRNILTFLLHLGHWLNECVSLGYRKMFYYPFLRGAVNNFRFIFFSHFSINFENVYLVFVYPSPWVPSSSGHRRGGKD